MDFSENDDRLESMAEQFEDDYFDDITFKRPEFQEILFTYFDENTGERIIFDDFEDDAELCYPTLFRNPKHRWTFAFSSGLPPHVCGRYVPEERKILISSSQSEYDVRNTLLHEMIHAYEDFYLSGSRALKLGRRDFLVIQFLKEFKNKSLIDKAFAEAAPVIGEGGTGNIGHSIFLALKCYLLDEKLGLKPGTIFGYGRDS